MLEFDFANNLLSVLDFSSLDFGSLNLDLDLSNLHLSSQIIAQNAQQFNQDVTKDIAGGWNNFVKTGQVWALIIGIVLGYLFKSITSF